MYVLTLSYCVRVLVIRATSFNRIVSLITIGSAKCFVGLSVHI